MASSYSRSVSDYEVGHQYYPCGLSDVEVEEIDHHYFMGRSNYIYFTNTLLESLIGETIMISIRTLVVVNSYNCITGRVKQVDENNVLIENCTGFDNYGNRIEGEKWFLISSFTLYHPAMLAFFRLTENDN